MKKFSLIYITGPTRKEAEKIANVFIEEKLATCVNIFPVESIYKWRGKIEKTKEFGMLVKTKTKLTKEIIKKVKEIHPYKTPCLISLLIESGNQEFLNWINKETI